MVINADLFKDDQGATPRLLLPKYLPIIRACLGWTSSDLAEKIGVSRTTISAFEKAGKENREIELMPYLAIRKVLDDEISMNPEETEVLAAVIGALVDQKDNPSIEEKIEICRRVIAMSKEIKKAPEKRKATSKAWSAYLVASGVIVTGAIIALLKGKKT
ncbi:MAG: helix-turn-helix domain-containing protein [Clostridia bacterium]